MRSLFYFFSLTYLVSWSLFITAAFISRYSTSSESPFSPFGYVIYLTGVFAPSIVAVFLSWREKGKAGVVVLLKKIFKAPADVRLYLFAVGYLITIKLVAAVIFRITFAHWPLFGQESLFIILIAAIFSTPIQAGEEIGWRGFALPRLANRFGLATASLILGIIWAAWHLPFFFIHNTDKFGQSFPVYLLSVTAISVAMAWLYWRSNSSLLMTMLMHSAINNTTGIVPSGSLVASNYFSINASFIAWTTTAIMCVFAVYFLRRMRGARIELD